jgi:hypothetical protein
VAGVELLLDFSDFSAELDVLLSLDPELAPDSLVDDPLVELIDFLPDSRLSVR